MHTHNKILLYFTVIFIKRLCACYCWILMHLRFGGNFLMKKEYYGVSLPPPWKKLIFLTWPIGKIYEKQNHIGSVVSENQKDRHTSFYFVILIWKYLHFSPSFSFFLSFFFIHFVLNLIKNIFFQRFESLLKFSSFLFYQSFIRFYLAFPEFFLKFNCL